MPSRETGWKHRVLADTLPKGGSCLHALPDSLRVWLLSPLAQHTHFHVLSPPHLAASSFVFTLPPEPPFQTLLASPAAMQSSILY